MPERAADLLPAQAELFEQLRQLRKQIAAEESVPPYIVFNDRTLIEMAVKEPVSKKEMLAVSGVGEKKYEKYGGRFLALIRKNKGLPPEDLRISTNSTDGREVSLDEYHRMRTI